MGEGKSPKTKVRRGVGYTTKTELDGVNDLMDHHLAKVVLLLRALISTRSMLDILKYTYMLFIVCIFSNGSPIALLFALKNVVVSPTRDVIHSVSLPNANITLVLNLLHLLVLQVWLDTQHPRNADKGDEHQDTLNDALPGVQVRVVGNRSGRQEHSYEHVQQTGWLSIGLFPVDRPLVNDTDDEVSENALKEK